MIRLAMELPTAKLKEWSPLADLDFVLAHQVLLDKSYAAFFRCRPVGRELILDNSLHELGFPLTVGDLLEAAKRCRADYVIAPDKVGDVEFNLDQFQTCSSVLRSHNFQTAVVMTGEDDVSRGKFLSCVSRADMLCLTFKEENRLRSYMSTPAARSWHRIHLLGVDSLPELREFRSISNRAGVAQNWSVDTAKALKWAVRKPYTPLDRLASLRMAGPENALKSNGDSFNLLNATDFTDEQETRFKDNVRILKEYCV